MEVRRRFIVSGVVQGVGFRYHAQKQAAALGLTGWVRNLDDGDVELLACGVVDQVDRLRDWLGRGPSLARVSGVKALEVDNEVDAAEELPGFHIR